MSIESPVIGIACNPTIRETYLAPADLERLEAIATVRFGYFTAPWTIGEPPPPDPGAEASLADFAHDLDALVVCHGAPRVTAGVLAKTPRLRAIGELEGDRFAGRIDVAAATERGITVVDTTHGSSYPVAEWALALAILGLRDSGADPGSGNDDDLAAGSSYERKAPRELTGKRVGLIGFGHIGWRLAGMLRPFDVRIRAFDPYAPRELADALDVTFAPLEVVLAGSDVVICLAPLTPGTRGMLGARELALLTEGSVFVNVSRGAVVDSAALVDRLRSGDIVACLDVYDPEPVPPDDPIRALPHVFLSRHVAGTTTESRTRFFTYMVDELARLIDGAEPRAQLTPAIVSRRTDPQQPNTSPDAPGGEKGVE